jgi:predicted alpha/beta hydrolase family esterase
MANIVIDIPGYNHSSESIWHPEFQQLIAEEGNEVITLDLPGGKYPVFTDWYPIIEQAVREAQYPVTLVGHSLGTRAVLLFLEQTEELRVENIILIGPFDNNTANAKFRDGNYANFFEHSIDIARVKQHIRDKIIVVGSEDDANIPFIQAQNIARDLEGELITISDSGHFLDAKWAKLLSEIVVR